MSWEPLIRRSTELLNAATSHLISRRKGEVIGSTSEETIGIFFVILDHFLVGRNREITENVPLEAQRAQIVRNGLLIEMNDILKNPGRGIKECQI